MKRRTLLAFTLTLAVLVPIVFWISSSGVQTGVTLKIFAGVIAMVVWTIPYATRVDPWLRRQIGSLFGVSIEWGGYPRMLSWTPSPELGCLAGLFVDLLTYVFIALWFVPFALVIGLAIWAFH